MDDIPHFERSLFLEGPVGVGKTAAAARFIHDTVVNEGHRVMVIIPYPSLLHHYLPAKLKFLNAEKLYISTFTNFVLGMLRHFDLMTRSVLPDPDQPVTFATPEVAYYHILRIATPYLESGLLDDVRLSPTRLCHTIENLLNQAASAGLSLDTAIERLTTTWEVTQPHRPHVYSILAQITQQYRAFCLSQSLLDLPLALDIFNRNILDLSDFREYIHSRFSLVVMDNVEDMSAVAHDFALWVPETVSKSLFIYDQDAGHQAARGIDPVNAQSLAEICDNHVTWQHEKERIGPVGVSYRLTSLIRDVADWPPVLPFPVQDMVIAAGSVNLSVHPVYSQAVMACVEKVISLVDRGVPLSEIAILSPYLSRMTCVDLQSSLKEANIPSTACLLADAPPQCMKSILTLAQLGLDHGVSRHLVAQALSNLITVLDPVRAALLSQTVYHKGILSGFDSLTSNMQHRITGEIGARYERLRLWLEGNALLAQNFPLNVFVERFAHEVLSQPGYLLSLESKSASTVAHWVSTLEDFATAFASLKDWTKVNLEIIKQINTGNWSTESVFVGDQFPSDVIIAPASVFMRMNRTVDYQFWMDIGSQWWWREQNTAFINPFILRRSFTLDAWTNTLHADTQRQTLQNYSCGLLRRCRLRVYANFVEQSLSDFRQVSPLAYTLQALLHQWTK